MFQYAPSRIISMMRHKDLTRSDVKACATFCYYEYHQWLLFSGIGTNFPTGYKVQNSVKKHGVRTGLSQAKPPKADYDVLRWVLVEGVAFKEVAYRRLQENRGKSVGAPKRGFAARTAHRKGKELFRKSLRKFAASLAS